jgi:hypothetical protein
LLNVDSATSVFGEGRVKRNRHLVEHAHNGSVRKRSHRLRPGCCFALPRVPAGVGTRGWTGSPSASRSRKRVLSVSARLFGRLRHLQQPSCPWSSPPQTQRVGHKGPRVQERDETQGVWASVAEGRGLPLRHADPREAGPDTFGLPRLRASAGVNLSRRPRVGRRAMHPDATVLDRPPGVLRRDHRSTTRRCGEVRLDLLLRLGGPCDRRDQRCEIRWDAAIVPTRGPEGTGAGTPVGKAARVSL